MSPLPSRTRTYYKPPRARTIILQAREARRDVGGVRAAVPLPVLHFDVNETIMQGRPGRRGHVRGVSEQDHLQSALVQTRGTARGGMPTRWRDGSAIARQGQSLPRSSLGLSGLRARSRSTARGPRQRHARGRSLSQGSRARPTARSSIGSKSL